MALVPAGSTPDWAAIDARAREILAIQALAPDIVVDDSLLTPHPSNEAWCAGRCLPILLNHHVDAPFRSAPYLSSMGRFDHRRARRRRNGTCPTSFTQFSGAEATSLWRLGFSPRRRAVFAAPSILLAFAHAMVEMGARRVELCPGLLPKGSAHPISREAMELLDSERLDPIRARWAIEKSSSLAVAWTAQRSRSL